eukprot:GSChrysophyteH1.ASY1.ANO1.929.1 assembled CDS
MSFWELMIVLKPFFWPDKGSDSATINRIRTSATWLSVFSSKALFKELQGSLYVKVKQQALIQLQRRTFSHLHHLSLGWHLTKKTGAVMKSMDRGIDATNSIVSYLFLYLIPAMGECVAVMVLFFVKFNEAWLVGLSIAIAVTLYILCTIRITIWRKKFRVKMNKNDNDYHDKATDSITNFETVKYFAAEDYEVNRYTNSVIKYQKYHASCMVACLLIAGKAVSEGEMTIGTWVAIQSWVNQIFQPLNFLGTIYSGIVQALIDVSNLSELLAEKADVVDAPDARALEPTDDANDYADDSGKSAPIADLSSGIGIEFRNVRFHYPTQPPGKGLQNVNFIIPPGSTTAIVGSTGAGKTTISRMMFRFYEPLEGQVFLGDYDIAACTQHSIRSLIGVVPQDTVMFNEKVYAVAEAAQIRTFIESLDESWGTVVGERGLKLSGGEKQRVAIARCLLKNPPVVLLDEATSALDTVTENSIQEALDTLGVNRTVVVIAHRLSTVRYADQILVMDQGMVKESGTHDELVAIDNGIYRKLWMMQDRRSEPASPVLEVEEEPIVEAAAEIVVSNNG